jgi:hypothetical protein
LQFTTLHRNADSEKPFLDAVAEKKRKKREEIELKVFYRFGLQALLSEGRG